MAEEVVFKISAKWDELNKTLTSSSKAIDDWSKKNMGGFSSMAQSLGTLALRFSALVGPVVGAGAAIYGLAQKTANAGDELHDMSKRTGIAVESLSGLKYAAELSGSSLEGVAVGLKFLGRNMADAKNGTGEAKDAFKALGINVADSTGKLRSTEEVFLQLSDKFKRMEDGAGKTALAMQIFGRSGSDLIPLLNEGGDGIRKMTEEARKLGITFTTEGAAAADQFNDNMTRLKGNFNGLVQTIGNDLIPTLNKLFETLNPKQNAFERLKEVEHLIDIYPKLGKGAERTNERLKELRAERERLLKELTHSTPGQIGGKKEQAPAVVDTSKQEAFIDALHKQTLDAERKNQEEAYALALEYTQKRLEAKTQGAAALKAVDDWYAAEATALDRKQTKDAAKEAETQLAADNKYHLDKWQSETEWAAKERELQGKTIAESLADTSKAIDEEIQLQLHLIDMKEKEGAISPIAAIEERIKWEQSLLAIQEDALNNAEAYTLEWYAAAEAVAKTREDIVGLTKSKLSVAIDILSSPTKAIEEGVRYLADALSSIPEKLQTAWEALKGLFSNDSGEAGKDQDKKQINKLLESAGQVGQTMLLVKAVADLPKILITFIKDLMQSLFDFPKYFIELFENVLARLPVMLSAVLGNLWRMFPKMIDSIGKAIGNIILGLVDALLGWIPGLKVHKGDDSSGIDENTKVVSELTKSIEDLNDSINKQITDMLTSSDSPAAAIERLQVAWGEVSKLKETFLSATGKEKVEIGKELQEALKAYLDVAQEAYQRPSEEYQQAFDMTIGELKNIQEGLAGIPDEKMSTYSVTFDTGAFSKAIAEMFSRAWKDLKNIFSDAWKGFKNIFSGINWPKLDFSWPKIDWPSIQIKFHDGGMIGKAHSGAYINNGTLAADEVPIIAKVGEGVLNDYNGMKAIGGEAGLNYINKTGTLPKFHDGGTIGSALSSLVSGPVLQPPFQWPDWGKLFDLSGLIEWIKQELWAKSGAKNIQEMGDWLNKTFGVTSVEGWVQNTGQDVGDWINDRLGIGHDGGMIKSFGINPGLAANEVPIITKVGEGILNDYNGMKAIGGEAGLNYANKTGRMMGGGSVVYNQSYSVSPQVTINTKGEVDTASLVRQIVRATEDSLKYGKMKQIVNS